MIYVVPGHSLLYVSMLMDKTLGRGSYSVVSSNTPIKRKSSIFLVDGFNTYKSRLSRIKFGYRVAILIFDSPFKIEESLPCVDMAISDLNSQYRPLPFSIPDPKKGSNPVTLLNLNTQTIKAVEFFTVSSVMDKAITFIYKCSSNRTRPKVRKVIFDYIIGDITKRQVMDSYAKDIRRSTLDKGVDLLMSIFDWMESDKGLHFREVIKMCIGKSNTTIKEIADREGVDRFDINTMLINMKQE